MHKIFNVKNMHFQASGLSWKLWRFKIQAALLPDHIYAATKLEANISPLLYICHNDYQWIVPFGLKWVCVLWFFLKLQKKHTIHELLWQKMVTAFISLDLTLYISCWYSTITKWHFAHTTYSSSDVHIGSRSDQQLNCLSMTFCCSKMKGSPFILYVKKIIRYCVYILYMYNSIITDIKWHKSYLKLCSRKANISTVKL